jgi:hypothetical protein
MNASEEAAVVHLIYMGTELALWFQGRNLLELGIGMHCTITINIPPSMEGPDGWITKMASISFSLFCDIIISDYCHDQSFGSTSKFGVNQHISISELLALPPTLL